MKLENVREERVFSVNRSAKALNFDKENCSGQSIDLFRYRIIPVLGRGKLDNKVLSLRSLASLRHLE